jgi:DNA-binding response OmpR family regulator
VLARQAKCPCCGQPVDPDTLYVDLAGNRVMRGGTVVPVLARVADFIHVLYPVMPATVDRQRLIVKLWGASSDMGSGKSLELCASKARRALAPFGYTIKCTYGIGYRMVRL